MADLRAVQYIRNGSFKEALRFIPEHQEQVNYILQFWQLRSRAFEKQLDELKRAAMIVHEWKVFYRLYLQVGLDIEYYRSLREWVFTLLRGTCRKVLEGTQVASELTYYLGVSHLMLREYQDAVNWANHAVQKEQQNMRYLALLACCWERLGHDYQARLLYREAYYQDPDAVETACLSSQIIDTVIERILHFRYPVESIQYWIPVFGRIFSLFNVKRALTTLEYSSLVKRVRQLESSLEGAQTQGDLSVLPKLLNGYLWMIDYHTALRKNQDRIQELESQLQDTDERVYQLYIEHAQGSNEFA